jgi:tetratricopeptide (TPR) repeat protein
VVTERDRLGTALRRLGNGRASAAELAWIAETTARLRDGNGAMVLGWHYHGREQWAEARRWFDSAMAWRPAPSAAEGLVYTMIAQGETAAARRLAESWADRVPALREALTGGTSVAGAAFEQRDLSRVIQVTNQAAAEGALAASDLVLRGWSLHELGRHSEAAAAFRQALDDPRLPAGQRTDAGYGLALTQMANGLTAEARATMDRHGVTGERARGLQATLLNQQAIDAYERRDYRRALELIRQVHQTTPGDRSLAMIEAWSLYNLRRYGEAHQAFRQLYQTYRSAEAAEGLRLAQNQLYPQ